MSRTFRRCHNKRYLYHSDNKEKDCLKQKAIQYHYDLCNIYSCVRIYSDNTWKRRAIDTLCLKQVSSSKRRQEERQNLRKAMQDIENSDSLIFSKERNYLKWWDFSVLSLISITLVAL